MKTRMSKLETIAIMAAIITLLGTAGVHADTITVTSTADSGAGTLRSALASVADGDTIDVTGVHGTILLTGGQLVVSNSVTILGPGPANLAVDGNAASRVFHIANGVTVTIASLTITNGNAGYDDGGGIYNDGSTLTVSNCTLSGNSATNGGGINNSGTLAVANSTLSSNSAVDGAGIFNDGTLTVATSTLSGNSATNGGGIFNEGYVGGATLAVSACTFSGNSGDYGGGIYNDARYGSATVEIGDTILKAGASGANITNDLGTVTSRGYNLSSDDGGGFLRAGGDQKNTDPKLGPLADNGGPTFTHALLAGSRAIDRGKRDAIPALASDTDQRGFQRPFDVPTIGNVGRGDGSDIGAFEAECPDLTGTWSSLWQSCRTWSHGLRCLLKGSLLVRNIGPIDAPISSTSYYLSSDDQFDAGDMFLKTIPTCTLKAGKSRARPLTMYMPYGISASDKFIIAVIDVGDTAGECTISNNVVVVGLVSPEP